MKDIKVKCSVGQFLVRIFLSEIYGGSFGNAFFFQLGLLMSAALVWIDTIEIVLAYTS